MRGILTSAELPFLQPGTVLSTQKVGGVEHFGVLTEMHLYGLQPTVISASKVRQAVVEEDLFSFASGAVIYSHGVWSEQPWHIIISRARSRLGEPYRLFDKNCEHFVRLSHGLPQQSPQLAAAVGAIVISGFLALMLAA